MKRKLVRVGNSLAITLPHDLVKEFALRPGMEVDATVDPRDGSFVVRTGVKLFEEGAAILGDQVVVAIGCTGCVAANRWECWDVSSRITATHEGASCETI